MNRSSHPNLNRLRDEIRAAGKTLAGLRLGIAALVGVVLLSLLLAFARSFLLVLFLFALFGLPLYCLLAVPAISRHCRSRVDDFTRRLTDLPPDHRAAVFWSLKYADAETKEILDLIRKDLHAAGHVVSAAPAPEGTGRELRPPA